MKETEIQQIENLIKLIRVTSSEETAFSILTETIVELTDELEVAEAQIEFLSNLIGTQKTKYVFMPQAEEEVLPETCDDCICQTCEETDCTECKLENEKCNGCTLL